MTNGASSPSPAAEFAVGDGTQVHFTKELMPTQSLLRMKSQASDKSKESPLFVVHAIEGVVTPLLPLAAKMNRPVYGLQCVASAPLDSITELAAYYIQQIKSVQPKGPFSIIGYSFGGCVAYEIVSQLENENEKCNLIMIDGSPTYVSWYTETQKQRNMAGTAASKGQDESYALAFFGLVCGKLDYKKVIQFLTIVYILCIIKFIRRLQES